MWAGTRARTLCRRCIVYGALHGSTFEGNASGHAILKARDSDNGRCHGLARHAPAVTKLSVAFCTIVSDISCMNLQDGRRLLLVINPQWQTQGQVVSDFGCGLLFNCGPAVCSTFVSAPVYDSLTNSPHAATMVYPECTAMLGRRA